MDALAILAHAAPLIAARKVGGIRFVRIGRLCFSFCLARRVP